MSACVCMSLNPGPPSPQKGLTQPQAALPRTTCESINSSEGGMRMRVRPGSELRNRKGVFSFSLSLLSTMSAGGFDRTTFHSPRRSSFFTIVF